MRDKSANLAGASDEENQITRAPTLEDVARSAGLVPMTVSRALNSLTTGSPQNG